jgi:hypothetical protein
MPLGTVTEVFYEMRQVRGGDPISANMASLLMGR